MKKKNVLKPRKIAKQIRSQETIAIILEATGHLLEKQGLNEISTTQIAKRAGVSVGSIYQFFPNKESLVAALFEFQIKQNMATINRLFDDMDTLPSNKGIELLIHHVCTLYFSKRNFFRNLFVEVGPLHLEDLLVASRQSFFKRIARNIAHSERKAITITNAVMGVIWANLFSSQATLPTAIVEEELVALVRGYLKP